MYIPLHQLCAYDAREAKEVSERWITKDGIKHQKYIMELIKKGAGEDFLQSDFENGRFDGFLQDMWDLRGFPLHSEIINFPQGDNFEAIDFSYSRFGHLILRNCFFRSSFHFARFLTVIF